MKLLGLLLIASTCMAQTIHVRTVAEFQAALNTATDTVWMHGGTYTGYFQANTRGTPTKPVVFRAYGNDHVQIQGPTSAPEGIALLVMSTAHDVWFWGIEFAGVNRSVNGIVTQQIGVTFDNVRFINCVIHDFQNGIALWREATNSTIYGCLIYNNGYDASDRGHGHGIYAMNQTGRKVLADNIIFNGYANGIQAYGAASQFADNFTLRGNVLINSGNLSAKGGGWNLIAGREGSTSITVGDSVLDNMTYRSSSNSNFGGIAFGWDGGQQNGVLTGNYLVSGGSGDCALKLTNCIGLTMTGNTVIGPNIGGTYAGNIYLATRPTSGVKTFLRPNKYDSQRANLIVYNWAGLTSVVVGVSPWANAGDTVTTVNAQNYYGDKPQTAICDASGNIRINMTGWTVAQAVGGPVPETTFPTFGAFVLTIAPGKIVPEQAKFTLAGKNLAGEIAVPSTGGVDTINVGIPFTADTNTEWLKAEAQGLQLIITAAPNTKGGWRIGLATIHATDGRWMRVTVIQGTIP